MSNVLRALSGLFKWYRTPAGMILAVLLIASAVAVLVGFVEVAALVLVVTVGGFFPYKLHRERRDRLQDVARLNKAIVTLKAGAATDDAGTMNEVDRLAGEVASLTAQLQVNQQRSLELQRQYGQLETRVAKADLSPG